MTCQSIGWLLPSLDDLRAATFLCYCAEADVLLLFTMFRLLHCYHCIVCVNVAAVAVHIVFAVFVSLLLHSLLRRVQTLATEDTLVRIFQAYSSFGDRKSTQHMSDFKFLKLAREAALIVRTALPDVPPLSIPCVSCATISQVNSLKPPWPSSL